MPTSIFNQVGSLDGGGAIRMADLNGLRDMDSFLIYQDDFVTFVPTVNEMPSALKLYYVNQPPEELNRDKSFTAWMKKLIEAWSQFLDTPASATGITACNDGPRSLSGDVVVSVNIIRSSGPASIAVLAEVF